MFLKGHLKTLPRKDTCLQKWVWWLRWLNNYGKMVKPGDDDGDDDLLT